MDTYPSYPVFVLPSIVISRVKCCLIPISSPYIILILSQITINYPHVWLKSAMFGRYSHRSAASWGIQGTETVGLGLSKRLFMLRGLLTFPIISHPNHPNRVPQLRSVRWGTGCFIRIIAMISSYYIGLIPKSRKPGVQATRGCNQQNWPGKTGTKPSKICI